MSLQELCPCWKGVSLGEGDITYWEQACTLFKRQVLEARSVSLLEKLCPCGRCVIVGGVSM